MDACTFALQIDGERHGLAPDHARHIEILVLLIRRLEGHLERQLPICWNDSTERFQHHLWRPARTAQRRAIEGECERNVLSIDKIDDFVGSVAKHHVSKVYKSTIHGNTRVDHCAGN